MPIKNLNPYISCNGAAEQAIHLYESALGAKVQELMRFSQMPCETIAPEHHNRIMHCMLAVGDRTLMLSDGMPDKPVPPSGHVSIALDFADSAEMAKAFDALAAGGTVTMPIGDAFWGAKFGMLIDAFGVHWMFHCALPKE
jgi:PhnB protein